MSLTKGQGLFSSQPPRGIRPGLDLPKGDTGLVGVGIVRFSCGVVVPTKAGGDMLIFAGGISVDSMPCENEEEPDEFGEEMH